MNKFVLDDDVTGLAHYPYVMLIMFTPGLIGALVSRSIIYP